MLNLNEHTRFWLYNRPVNMRKSFCGLQGIATNELESRVADGNVFIFVNRNRNKMKILASEDGNMVIYALCLKMDRMHIPDACREDVLSMGATYDDVVSLVRSVMDSPYVRRMKLLL